MLFPGITFIVSLLVIAYHSFYVYMITCRAVSEDDCELIMCFNAIGSGPMCYLSHLICAQLGLPLLNNVKHLKSSKIHCRPIIIVRSSVGWLISQGQVLVDEGKCVITQIKAELKDSFGLKIRNTLGWSISLSFVNQV